MTNASYLDGLFETLFAAQCRNDLPAIRALLADDLEYRNVLVTYRGADDFVRELAGFNSMLRGIRIIHVVAHGDGAAVLYDCELPEPVGTLRTGWFVRIEGGKLRTIDSVFDATEIRKLFAAKLEGG